MHLLASLVVENLKILIGDPELRQCHIFGPKMIPLPQRRNFSEKQYI